MKKYNALHKGNLGFLPCFNSSVLTPIVILVNYLQETKLG